MTQRIFAATAFALFTLSAILAGCADASSTGSDKIAPSLILYSPRSNDTILYGKTEIIFESYDDQGLGSIDVFIDGTKAKTYYVKDGVRPPCFLEFDSSQTGSKHSYSIKVADLSGNSIQSSTMTDIYVTNTKSAPFPVTDLTVLRISETVINIAWKDTASFVKGYELQRRLGFDGSWFVVKRMNVGINNTNDQIPDPSQLYFYRIRSYNDFGSSYSALVNSYGSGGSGKVPAPTNLTATVLGAKKVLLTWKNNAANPSYLKIERRTWGAFSTIAVLAATATSYQDSGNGLNPNYEYTYRVKVIAESDSAWSAEKTITTFPYDMNRPTNLVAARYNPKTLKLNWKDNSAYETSTLIERKSAINTQWTVIGSVGTDITVYYDSVNTVSGTRYWYRVRGTDGSIFSDYSDEAWADLYGTGVAAPTNFTALVRGTQKVELSWQDNATNETFYQVERKQWGAFEILSTLPPNTTKYTDSANGLSGSLQYTYRVRVCDGLDTSFSTEKTVTMSSFDLTKPTGLQAVKLSPLVVKLTWQDNNWNESETIIEKKSSGNPNYMEWGRVGQNVTTWTDSMALPWLNARVWYRVKAANGTVISEYSDEVWVDLNNPDKAITDDKKREIK